MPKIKILLVDESYYDYDDNYHAAVLRSGITDWEEVSQEDYDFLVRNKFRLKSNFNANIVIVTQDDTPVLKRIQDIKAEIQKEIDKAEEEKNKKKKRAEENRLKKLAKTEAEEKELLNMLKSKYDESQYHK